MYSFTANKKYLILCLLIPYLIHGFYNFLDYPYHFIVVGMLTIYAIALHSNFKKLQSEKLKEVEVKKI
jgi:hypothetical protein